MNISSNTLFHFTSKLSILKSILSEGFKLSYCLEDFSAFPMVSFCDIPISLIGSQNYGKYGIGLSLDWGYRNKLSPVVYFQEDSELIASWRRANEAGQKDMMKVIKKGDFKLMEGIRPYIEFILESSRYHKHYMDDLVRQDKVYPNHKFYNEREWRFVPKMRSAKIQDRMSQEEYEEYKMHHEKPHIHENPLRFKASDIRYLILESNSEISEFISYLDTQKHLFETQAELDILKTRITTSEMINEDV